MDGLSTRGGLNESTDKSKQSKNLEVEGLEIESERSKNFQE